MASLALRQEQSASAFDAGVDDARHWLPPEVRKLAPREREVATIVYSNGAVSAKDVEALLSTPLSNGAVRSMLVRLVRKGVLRRTWGSRGPGCGHYYLPSITPAHVKKRALREISDHYFNGSLMDVALAAANLLNDELLVGRALQAGRSREHRRDDAR